MKPVGIAKRGAHEALEVVSDVEGGMFVAKTPLGGRLIASRVIELAGSAIEKAGLLLEEAAQSKDPALLGNFLIQGEEPGLYIIGEGVVVSIKHEHATLDCDKTQIITDGSIRELWPPSSDM